MADALAAEYDVKLVEVLTGFKYIGEQIKLFERDKSFQYVFGLEESYGCLAGTYARDKDACVAVMMLCEAAAFYKCHNMTLWDAMTRLYEKYGYYRETLSTMTLKGIEGTAKIQKIMNDLRSSVPEKLGDFKVEAIRDYEKGIRIVSGTKEQEQLSLPKSNVLYFELENDGWCCARPSGTEPKIKFYMGVKGTSLEQSKELVEKLQATMLGLVE